MTGKWGRERDKWKKGSVKKGIFKYWRKDWKYCQRLMTQNSLSRDVYWTWRCFKLKKFLFNLNCSQENRGRKKGKWIGWIKVLSWNEGKWNETSNSIWGTGWKEFQRENVENFKVNLIVFVMSVCVCEKVNGWKWQVPMLVVKSWKRVLTENGNLFKGREKKGRNKFFFPFLRHRKLCKWVRNENSCCVLMCTYQSVCTSKDAWFVKSFVTTGTLHDRICE